jgi:toxin HigB-1
MDIEFKNQAYHRLEIDPSYLHGFPREVVKAYRSRVRWIRGAVDVRDLYAIRSFRFEKLIGNRAGQYSMRLNDQWRLILKLVRQESCTAVIILAIEDYH